MDDPLSRTETGTIDDLELFLHYPLGADRFVDDAWNPERADEPKYPLGDDRFDDGWLTDTRPERG